MNTETRFWRKVKKTDTCWLWTACTSNGYAHFVDEKGNDVGAHRWVYRKYKGEIPLSFQIHHECKNKICVNPDHLQAVSASKHRSIESPIRKNNRCWLGHEMTEENTYVDVSRSGEYKLCRTCRTIANAKASRKRKLERWRKKRDRG